MSVLSIKGLHKNFGAAKIIQGIDLEIEEGEFHAIIGPNGAGKSTLFNLISGQFAPSSGAVTLHGSRISGLRPYQINRMGLSRSFQVSNIFANMSVFENLRCALMWSRNVGYCFWRFASRCGDIDARTDSLLEEIGLTARKTDMAGNLSYAEQRALEVGMTIAGGASVLLFDEPTAGMNHHEVETFAAFLRKIAKGRTVMMVEHDMNVVFSLADRISVLVYGQIIATGKPEDIRANPAVKEAYLGADA
ncbi:ABC transporter ATP-binding protein [Roseovarius sp. ZX-A-9]|uniref:ABC transporter ATP-binding protein n=1 Tax=Roseovarius sp. ZX-A-9 TaxID=3014783 RepID=UPI00232E06FA|nr:ABC transporter ATP-binding protein [Roseovarius sp. ZX-A-9]